MSTSLQLTSIECSELINWIAYYKCGSLLNKTQMQKILYIAYGKYLARTEKVLFEDDTPKAWPFGPVFPIVNKRFKPGFHNLPMISQSVSDKLKNDSNAFNAIREAVEENHNKTAYALSEWSHEINGPWYKTVYGDDDSGAKWNKVISQNLIKEYFKNIEVNGKED